jgi:hypothetical protein
MWPFTQQQQPAIVGGAYLGTDRLGRTLTKKESRELEALLRKSGYVDAHIIALAYAHKISHHPERARDLVARAALRLVRQGWEPKEATLRQRMCRLVYSEFMHEVVEDKTRRKAELGFVQGLGDEGKDVTAPREDEAIELEVDQRRQAHANARLDELRDWFVKAGDEVNGIWLEHARRGNEDLQEIARSSGRTVEELYLAAKRRKGHVRRLLAAKKGAPYEEEP